MSMSDQLVDPHDSTRVQVIHSRPEAISSNWVPKSATKECCGEDELGIHTFIYNKITVPHFHFSLVYTLHP